MNVHETYEASMQRRLRELEEQVERQARTLLVLVAEVRRVHAMADELRERIAHIPGPF